MFADRILLYRKDEEEFEVSLDRWRKVIEERGSKVSRKKTEYVEVGGAEQGTVYIQGGMAKKVDHFKYLDRVVRAEGSCEEQVRRRVQAGW